MHSKLSDVDTAVTLWLRDWHFFLFSPLWCVWLFSGRRICVLQSTLCQDTLEWNVATACDLLTARNSAFKKKINKKDGGGERGHRLLYFDSDTLDNRKAQQGWFVALPLQRSSIWNVPTWQQRFRFAPLRGVAATGATGVCFAVKSWPKAKITFFFYCKKRKEK